MLHFGGVDGDACRILCIASCCWGRWEGLCQRYRDLNGQPLFRVSHGMFGCDVLCRRLDQVCVSARNS